MIGGFIAGISGIGTGIVMLAVIPIALQSYDIPPHQLVSVIIANAIFATLVSSVANVATTLRQRSFYPRETWRVSIAAVITSFAIFEIIVKSDLYSKNFFNGILVFFMLFIIVQTFKKLKLSNAEDERVSTPRLLTTGSAAGVVAALTGLGGGTIIIPLLNLWQRVDIKKAKSISFGTILAIALWLTINNLFFEPGLSLARTQGLIIFSMTIPLSVGVLIGSPIGVIAGDKISSRATTIIFLTMTSLVTLQKIADLISLN